MRAARRAAGFGTLICGVTIAVTPIAAAAPTTPSSQCRPWTVRTVASGYAMLENLAFDGRGGMLLSNQSLTGDGGSIDRLTPDGARTSVVPDVTGPGGIVVDGATAFFTTGNTLESGVTGRADGTIDAVDLDTHRTTTIAQGLSSPNGLVRLPDGEFVVSKDVGAATGLTSIDPRTGRHHEYGPAVVSPNGLAVGPGGARLYTSTTFTPTSGIIGIDIAQPGSVQSRWELPGFGPLNAADDLTVGADGQIYAALNLAGQVVQIDPDTGQACTIARGLPLTTSVRFGQGPGWDARSLYATSYLGTVTRLTPPGA